MWLITGFGAVTFAILNLLWFFNDKEPERFRFISLSLSLLTVCSFYSDAAMRVINKDWTGLADIMPTVSGYLWVCVISSVVINSVSLFKRKK